MNSKKQGKDKIVFYKKNVRDNLVEFYNELYKALYDAAEAEIKAKRKWTPTKNKKVAKPILDKWEKIFNGNIEYCTMTFTIDDKTWKKFGAKKK